MDSQPYLDFPPLSSQELLKILGLTIKKDEENKLVTFLCQLSAYTETAQFNISFNAPSSTGKSYIPVEISSLFPKEDVIKIGYCSPTAFFHNHGQYVKDLDGYIVDLSRRILIFLDQPHTLLLQHLRPFLSHDEKEISIKITDKKQKFGIKTKNIILRGFSAVIFCTAGLKIDEQETTRFLLLSPETDKEKIREAIFEKIKKETNPDIYVSALENQPERQELKKRIQAIKEQLITDIKIAYPQKIEESFFQKNRILKPRHMRDIGRLIDLVKAFALLNLWHRERCGSIITANEEDINEALKIWNVISESQDYNLPPYVYGLYREVIIPAYKDSQGLGITRQEIMRKHYLIYSRPLADWQLRQQILPMLETAGLIIQEPDREDKRRIIIYPANSIENI